MSYTSLKFFVFLAAVMLLYFLFPWKKQKWTILLAASYFFYLLVGYRYAVFLLLTTISTYLAALWIEQVSLLAKQTLALHKGDWDKEEKKEFKNRTKQKKRRIVTVTLLLNFGILVFLKYSNMLVGSLNDVLHLFGVSAAVPSLNLFLPLGISFYTFQSMGYLLDVHREKVPAQKNLAKFALFVSFFPQIIQGPISMYDQLAHQLYAPNEFDFTRCKYGIELMLWGCFQKLVIADRAVIAINAATQSFADCNGTTLIFIVLLYAVQLYADFSGGIDISRGVAQLFGITMIQNFRQPYFATSISDYWHRWHISLGEWFKNYLFYPLAMSKAFVLAGKKIKGTVFGSTAFGSHVAKVLPTSFASFIVFFLVGIWHGPNWKYVAFGVWNGGIIMLSVLLKPMYSRWMALLRIQEESCMFYLFRLARTFLLVFIGYVFDVAPDFASSMQTFRRMLTDHSFSTAWAQIRGFPLEIRHYLIIALGFVLMLLVDIFHERQGSGSLRKVLDTKPFLVRYFLILGCLLVTLYFGVWGPNAGAGAFVYMQF